jgi:putative copper resistance protein D
VTGWSDAALVASRAVTLAGVLSLAGTLGVRLVVAPFPLARVTWPSLAVALVGGAVWLLLQSAAMAGASDIADALAAVPTVLGQTWFGHVFVARAVLLVLAGVLAGFAASPARLLLAGACAAVAVALQAAIGHAYASGNTLLMASEAAHVLAASAWLGGLLPLWLALDGTSPGRVARRFSLWALLAVAVIVASGLEQATVLIGSLSALFGTPYGRIALLKTGLLLVLLLVAGLNRFVFTPALDRAPADRRRLRASLAVEIMLGLCLISAAAALAAQAPPMDMPMSSN